MADVTTVRAVQSTVVAAGHELTLDWTEDASPAENYGSQLDASGKLAKDELNAVMTADAVLVIASEHDGRGMFVELGAALARAQWGELAHVVIVGEIRHESAFYFDPLVQRVTSVRDWLDTSAERLSRAPVIQAVLGEPAARQPQRAFLRSETGAFCALWAPHGAGCSGRERQLVITRCPRPLG